MWYHSNRSYTLWSNIISLIIDQGIIMVKSAIDIEISIELDDYIIVKEEDRRAWVDVKISFKDKLIKKYKRGLRII